MKPERYKWDKTARVYVAWFKYPDGKLGFTQAETVEELGEAVLSALTMFRKWYRRRRALRRGEEVSPPRVLDS